jgi:hypothetical protein
MYYDLNVPWTANAADLQSRLSFLAERTSATPSRPSSNVRTSGLQCCRNIAHVAVWDNRSGT